MHDISLVMAENEKNILENIGEQEYKYGFTTDIETETIGKGLSEEVVRLISAKKGEPEWMTERRVAAYRHWLTLEPPTWAHLTIPPIDFQDIICSLAPKSVTTPIAMEVSKATGGIPSLTAAVVVVVGLFGAVFGFKVLRVGHVGSPIAQGLSMGTATHAVGTSTAMEISGKYGAYASLGLTLNGIMTAIFTPTILRLLGVI